MLNTIERISQNPSINVDALSPGERGRTNTAYRHSSGPAELQEEEEEESSCGSGSLPGSLTGDPPDTPVRFSTAVQTVAPSTIATLRQNQTYLASLRTRNVSLV